MVGQVGYSLFRPAAFAFAHLARAPAAIAALPAALIFRLVFPADFRAPRAALSFAHRARAAAAILARPAALTFRLLRWDLEEGMGISPPRMWTSSVWSASILSRMSAALRRSFGVKVKNEFIAPTVWKPAGKSRCQTQLWCCCGLLPDRRNRAKTPQTIGLAAKVW